MLNVYVGNEITGDLFRAQEDHSKFCFAYNKDCILENAVSLSMPVIREQYISTYNKLHPIFDMNLPEGALRDRLRREFSKIIPQFDDLALLQIVGKSQIGRLRIAQPGYSLSEVPSQSIHELITHDGAEGLFESLLNHYAIYSGISGAQPKVMVRDDSNDINQLDRVTYSGATHIVKAWNKNEYPELAANEYFCMRAALHAKLEVPEFELSKNAKFLIVKRFDIENGIYLGFEDFCVLNGKTSDQKYDGSYENISNRIRDFVSPEYVRAALESFFKTLVLSCIIKNGDAHLKNFGVIYSSTESIVRFSPAYDLISTTPYYRKDILALLLNGTKRWPNNKILLNFARAHCDLTEARAKKLMSDVLFGVSIAIKELKHYTENNQSFRNIGKIMLEEWNAGLSQTANNN